MKIRDLCTLSPHAFRYLILSYEYQPIVGLQNGSQCETSVQGVEGLRKSVWWLRQPKLVPKVLFMKIRVMYSIRLWENRWIGKNSLKHCFPRLYFISLNQDQILGEVGSWTSDGSEI